jgi:hypothetical protein
VGVGALSLSCAAMASMAIAAPLSASQSTRVRFAGRGDDSVIRDGGNTAALAAEVTVDVAATGANDETTAEAADAADADVDIDADTAGDDDEEEDEDIGVVDDTEAAVVATAGAENIVCGMNMPPLNADGPLTEPDAICDDDNAPLALPSWPGGGCPYHA